MQLIGHRGARFEAPENTLAGFRHAIELGLSAVEFDVRVTRDNELVVIHDATVDRTTDGTGEVSSFSLAELRELDARAEFSDWPEVCQIPTLSEVLDVVEGHHARACDDGVADPQLGQGLAERVDLGG